MADDARPRLYYFVCPIGGVVSLGLKVCDIVVNYVGSPDASPGMSFPLLDEIQTLIDTMFGPRCLHSTSSVAHVNICGQLHEGIAHVDYDEAGNFVVLVKWTRVNPMEFYNGLLTVDVLGDHGDGWMTFTLYPIVRP